MVGDSFILDELVVHLEVKVVVFLILKLLFIDWCHQILGRRRWAHSPTLFDSSEHMNILVSVFLFDQLCILISIDCIHVLLVLFLNNFLIDLVLIVHVALALPLL